MSKDFNTEQPAEPGGERAARIEAERAREQLAEFENRFLQLAENIREVFWLSDPFKPEMLYVSPAYEEVWGRSCESLYGDPSSFVEAIHAEDRERVTAALDRQLGGENTDEVYRIVRPDGETRWVRDRAFAIRDSSGRIYRLAGIAEDITARRNMEERLREQTETVETVNRIGQMLSAELDLQKLVQALTDAATELTGAQFGSFFYNVLDDRGGSYMLYTLSGVPHEAFAHFPMPRATDLFGPTFRGEGVIRIADVKKDPRYGKNSPYYGMPPGHLPVISYLAVPVVSRSGEVLGGLFFGHPEAGVFTERMEEIVVGLAAQAAVAIDNARLYQRAKEAIAAREEALRHRDQLLTSEQEARAEAEAANRAKDEFLATVSHELRTPLNAILGWARMMRTGKLDEETTARAVETIERNAKSQAQIIEDILDVSRIITGRLRLDIRVVELASVIEAAIDAVQPAVDAKGIELRKSLDPKAGPVSGDPNRLQQVVWNLLSNAIKFTPKDGRAEVALERVDSHVEIRVSDSGQGITPDFLPFVFDRFRQADSTSTRRHGGLGLGLAIVRHLVEMHGGTVSAESPGEGRGATFLVRLPLMAVQLRDGDGVPRQDESGLLIDQSKVYNQYRAALEGLRVIVVDDEPDTRDMLSVVLRECGVKVKACASSAEAIKEVEDWLPDVLVADIGMPSEDGYQMMRKIRAMGARRGGATPAIALTAYAGVEDRLRALTAGFQMHIPKPVEPAELAAVIASLAGRSGGEA